MAKELFHYANAQQEIQINKNPTPVSFQNGQGDAIVQHIPNATENGRGDIVHEIPDITISLEGTFLPLPNTMLPYEEILVSWQEALYKYLIMPEFDFANLMNPAELAQGDDFLNVDFENLFDIPVDPRLEEAYQATQLASGGGIVSEERYVSFDLVLSKLDNDIFKLLSVAQTLSLEPITQIYTRTLTPVTGDAQAPAPFAPDLTTDGAFLTSQGFSAFNMLINEKYLNFYSSIEIQAHLLFNPANPFGFDVGATPGSPTPEFPSLSAVEVDASFSSSNQNPAGTQVLADRIILTTQEGNVFTLFTKTADGHTMGDFTYTINNPISTSPQTEIPIDLITKGDAGALGYDDHFLYSIINNYLNSAVGNLHFQIIDDTPQTHDQSGPTALESKILSVGSEQAASAEIVGGGILTQLDTPNGVLIIAPGATADPLPTDATYFGADKVGALVSKVTLLGVDNATANGSTPVVQVSNVTTTMSFSDIQALQNLGFTNSVFGDPAIKITDNVGNVFIIDQKTGEYLFYLNKAYYHSSPDSAAGNLGSAGKTADIKFAFTLTDGDGDVSNTSILTLHSKDDIATAFDNTNGVDETHFYAQFNQNASFKETAIGNLITDGIKDIFGADGKGSIASITIGSTTIVDGGPGDLDNTVNGSITADTTYGQIVIDTLGAGLGNYTYTLDIAKVQPLNGDVLHSVSDAIQYNITDGDGSNAQANLAITINLNETPIANADNLATTENNTQGFTGAALLSNDTDPDTGDTKAIVSVDTASSKGGIIVDNLNGTYSYNPNGKFDYLGQDETTTDTFTYVMKDAQGLTSTATVTVTITGENDAPIVANTDITGAVIELGTPVGNITDTGTIGFTDVDLTDSHTISSIIPNIGALGTLNATVTTDTTGSGVGGIITWDYSVVAQDVEYLAKDQTKIDTFDITLDDGHGGTVVRTVSVTITGTNDAPVVEAEDITGAITEQGTPSGDISDTGTIGFSDVDISDTHSISNITASVGALGSLNATITDTINGIDGAINWEYTVAAADIEYLAKDEIKIESFDITLDDGNGGTVVSTISVTITGTNDEPTGADNTVATVEDTPYVFAAADFGYSDVDTTDTFKAVKISSLPTNGTLTNDGVNVALNALILLSDITAGKLVFTPELDANGTDYAQFQFQVQDSSGAANDTDSTANTITIDVTAQNDAPIVSDSDSAAIYSISGDTAIVADTTVKSTDVDSLDLTKATISITDAQTGDILHYEAGSLPVGISISGNDSTTITLTGSASLTDYNTVLQNITFQTSDTTIIDRHVAWQVTDDAATDSNTFSSTITVVAPIVLDLDGNGFNLISANDSHMTLGDISGSTAKNTIGWIGQGDGVLMLNSNGDGTISNLNQISFTSYVAGAKTDLQGLIAFDTNHDGFLDKADDKYSQFGVLTADGKYESLSDLGINNISLISNETTQLLNGNVIFGTSSYETASGKSMQLADVGFAVGGSNVSVTLDGHDIIASANQVDYSKLPENTVTETSPTATLPISETVSSSITSSSVPPVVIEHIIPPVTQETHQ